MSQRAKCSLIKNSKVINNSIKFFHIQSHFQIFKTSYNQNLNIKQNFSQKLIVEKSNHTNNLSTNKNELFKKIAISKINNQKNRKNINPIKDVINISKKNIKQYTEKSDFIQNNSNIDIFNRNNRFNSSLNNNIDKLHINIHNKEFNKITLIKHKAIKEQKTETHKNFHTIIKKERKKRLFFINKKNSEKKNRKLELNKSQNLEIKMSTKFMKAQEKWKKNYLATVIQKLFRGHFLRKTFSKNKNREKNVNIYIKKKTQDKSLSKSKRIRNLTITNILNIQKKRMKTNILCNNNYSNSNNSVLCNDKTMIKENNSFQKEKKIKEIIIKKRKNCPIINLNLNNYNNFCYYNYLSNYNTTNILNNMYYSSLNKNNFTDNKYSENINLNNKVKNIVRFWNEISIKNYIIKSLIRNRKIWRNKDIKSDDTTTISCSDEIKVIHCRKNTKLYCVKKIKK